MKRDASYFDGSEPVLIYIAKRLRDAIRLESVLDTAGVDYGVEADTYRGGLIFQSERVGAFFYVLSASAERARQLLRENRFKPLE